MEHSLYAEATKAGKADKESAFFCLGENTCQK